jgi:hypothetical protein
VTPEQLPDYDSRASVAPTAEQLAAANALGANVSWSRFGTAASVIKYGGYVTTGLQAPDAASAARSWLDANKSLFRLDSTNALAVDTAAPLVGTSNDYAVVFRQRADGLTSTDGVVTVSVVGSKATGWKVAYASASLAEGSSTPTGSDALGPAVAWTTAANEAGVNVSVVDVTAKSTRAGTTTLAVDGLSEPQHVKKAVFATPHHGSREAYDATVTTKDADGTLSSYQVVVDAQTGAMLYRQDLVDYLTDNPTWLAFPLAPPTTPINRFPWNYPSTDTRELWCWTAIENCSYAASDATTV